MQSPLIPIQDSSKPRQVAKSFGTSLIPNLTPRPRCLHWTFRGWPTFVRCNHYRQELDNWNGCGTKHEPSFLRSEGGHFFCEMSEEELASSDDRIKCFRHTSCVGWWGERISSASWPEVRIWHITVWLSHRFICYQVVGTLSINDTRRPDADHRCIEGSEVRHRSALWNTVRLYDSLGKGYLWRIRLLSYSLLRSCLKNMNVYVQASETYYSDFRYLIKVVLGSVLPYISWEHFSIYSKSYVYFYFYLVISRCSHMSSVVLRCPPLSSDVLSCKGSGLKRRCW
jgi:hypothetical protein